MKYFTQTTPPVSVSKHLKMEHQKIRRELDDVFQATESFIVDYSSRMEQPVQFLASVVSDLQGSQDKVLICAHLETLQSTLLQMDSILIELTHSISSPGADKQ
jgi:bisphosphoglycerate-dependent phosphoglycerate mutase